MTSLLLIVALIAVLIYARRAAKTDPMVALRAELIIADRDAEPDIKRDGRKVLDSFFENHPELRPACDAQVNEFVERQRDYFVPKVLRGDKITVADFDKIPMFIYEEETLAVMTGRVATSLLGLLLLSAVCLYGAALKLRRFTIIG